MTKEKDKQPKCSNCDDKGWIIMFNAEDWEQIEPCPCCNKKGKLKDERKQD